MKKLIIIGQQKAGTTSLHYWLESLPEIVASPVGKDYPYFTRLWSSEGRDPFYVDRKLDPQYKYLLHSDVNIAADQDAIKRMLDSHADLKVILVLRDPIERMISSYNYAVERGLEKRSIDDAIEAELSGIIFEKGTYEARQMNYISHSKFYENLRYINSTLPSSNFELVKFSDLKYNSSETFYNIVSNLGLTVPEDFQFKIHNATKGASRVSFLNKILYTERRNQIWKIVRVLVPNNIRKQIRSILVFLNRSNKPSLNTTISEGMQKRLHIEFHQEYSILENE